MQRLLLFSVFVLLAFVSLFTACKPDPSLEPQVSTELPIEFKIPKSWPHPAYQFQNNTLTKEGFELGKRLFFDTRLSRDNSTSCGSCHQPFSAFAQLDHDVSHGVDNKLGTRNSPPLFNLNWHTSFFWDGGVNHIESQPINPIENPVEMDETVDNIITKLSANAEYRKMFTAAFGSDLINSQRIFKALAQFMGMLVSSNSKYDKHQRNETGGEFTTAEQNGYVIYKDKCSGCHTEPLMADFNTRNNGLKPTNLNDSGRAHITKDPKDLYKFKVASLRNLKYTAPYMHDGRFSSLEQVLNYYATGVHDSPTLDPLVKGGIQLTAEQRSDLLAFLNTLNDESFTKDPRFQEVVVK